jgi:hypothetical protein
MMAKVAIHRFAKRRRVRSPAAQGKIADGEIGLRGVVVRVIVVGACKSDLVGSLLELSLAESLASLGELMKCVRATRSLATMRVVSTACGDRGHRGVLVPRVVKADWSCVIG